jgi:hypothetical protein
MATHRVPSHRWSRGKNGTHPGYTRHTRPKSKVRRIEKREMKGMHQVRDPKTGYVLGWRFKE